MLFGPLACWAVEGIHIRSADFVPVENGYALEANFDIGLTTTLEDALVRGLTLVFTTEFELFYPRWWTFNVWDKTVTERRIEHRLSYNALTRQYRLSSGALHQSFDTVNAALAVLGRVRINPAVRSKDLEDDKVYTAVLRLHLDKARLPKPLQVDALASHDWDLSSDWYRWTFRP
ncbi:MAG TPA: DUF4390 domain-containing protein [Burkholderiales bacterium]|nr:DUF4390 domain-containing protein [Burkholderiales bacterium]